MSFGSFMSGLGGIIDDQFGIGENKNTSLDGTDDNGNFKRYGKLGDFASSFDQSAQRRYTEEGFIQHNLKAKFFEIMMQEPDVTILVKKRAFSSLAENYRLEFMNDEEKLFVKTSKILFENKCNQMAVFEKLSKVEKITSELGYIDDALLPFVFALTDIGSELFDATGLGKDASGNNQETGAFANIGKGINKLKSTVDEVRKIVSFSKNTNYTKWITQSETAFKNRLGQGTGVIEFTNVTQIRTTASLEFGGGGASFTLTDPYNILRITNKDIEKAIQQSTNSVTNKNVFGFATQSTDQIIAEKKTQLNNLRAARGAQPINFIVSPDTLLGKKVRAIIDGVGEEITFTYQSSGGLGGVLGAFKASGGVEIDSTYILGNNTDIGNNGLSDGTKQTPLPGSENSGFKFVNETSEVQLFSDVVKNIFTSLQIKNSSESAIKNSNKKFNSLRNKLRLHYGGKLLIQPMDVVHVYIGSKTREDNKIMGGLQDSASHGAGELLANLNNVVGDIKDTFNSLFDAGGNSNFNVEKAVLVGSDFPNWLWNLIRNQFIGDKSGAHVFAGIVTESSSSYSNGFYQVSVSAKDNAQYFQLGQINFKPSVDVFNGSLLEPLTPFKLKFDSVSGALPADKPIPELLDENKVLIGSMYSKHKSGPNVGSNATKNNSASDQEQSRNGTRKIVYDPSGSIYKWKEGIGSLTSFGDNILPFRDKTGNPSILTEPLAGQDVMNAISFLITGEPYNFATFYKAATGLNGGYNINPATGQNGAHTYFNTLKSNLNKRNIIWGNFIPYKKLVMDEGTYSKVLSGQLTVLDANSNINSLLSKRADLQDKILAVKAFKGIDAPVQTAAVDAVVQQVKLIDDEIKQNSAKFDSTLSDVNKLSKNVLSIAGNDVSIDFDSFLNTESNDSKALTSPGIRRELRKKSHFLTRRLAWKVRGNEDPNFLIVDDTYDKDYDIQAFEKSFAQGFETFNSEYLTISEKITQISQLLNLEVFADTQGHIQVRIPQYNKIPSSVFYRMLKLKKDLGIQLFPQFLEDLYVNHADSLLKKIEIIEDEIRLRTAVLGYTNDLGAVNFLNSKTIEGSAFSFLSEEDSGKIDLDLRKLFIEADPDKKADTVSQALEDITTRSQYQSGVTNFFNIKRRTDILNQTSSEVQPPKDLSSDTTIKIIVKRLFEKTGQKVDATQFLKRSSNNNNSSVSSNTLESGAFRNIDILNILNDISDRISGRQSLVKLAARALTNLKEAASLDKSDEKTGNELEFPNLFGNKEIPEVYENMLEDESYDDYGPGSGNRYVIKGKHIVNYTYHEKPPNFTMVSVNGLMADQFIDPSKSAQAFNISAAGLGGNALVSASAVDYDLWRMYGLMKAQQVKAPFLSDSETQCAPYAVALLARERGAIFTSQMTVIGNEFYQPGDVVYVEDMDMLFYVKEVSHDFTFGQKFSTRLTLTYGHNPGQYIPNMLDIVGKVLYKNKDVTSLVNITEENRPDQVSVGAIIYNTFNEDDTIKDNLFSGPFASANKAAIKNILNSAQSAINQTNNGTKATLEVRIYNSTGSDNEKLNFVAQLITSIFAGKDTIEKNDNTLPKNAAQIPKENLNGPVSINVSDSKELRYPSRQAFDCARNLTKEALKKTGFVTDNKEVNVNHEQTILESVMSNSIIDCWVVFTPIDTNTNNSG